MQYPRSNSYKNPGELENAKELSNVPPVDLVKVAGARASVGEAIEQLKVHCQLARSSLRIMLTVQQLQVTNVTQSEGITDSITVPLKYHNALASQGTIFCTLCVFSMDAEPSTHSTKSLLPLVPLSQAHKVKTMMHVEFLTLPDRSSFPCVVGVMGSKTMARRRLGLSTSFMRYGYPISCEFPLMNIFSWPC